MWNSFLLFFKKISFYCVQTFVSDVVMFSDKVQRECCSAVDYLSLFALCLCAESKGSCWSVASAGSSGPHVHTPLNGGRGRGKRGHCCALARWMWWQMHWWKWQKCVCASELGSWRQEGENGGKLGWEWNTVLLIGACKINVLWTLQLHKIGTC